MTDEDLDRIDAMVHEFVFQRKRLGIGPCYHSQDGCGWQVYSELPRGSAEQRAVFQSPNYNGESCADEVCIGGVPACWCECAPEYTRSWSDAGEVVEKMRPTHHVLIEGYWQGRWEVQFCVPSTEYTATAETLPLAITLAALSACGHQWKGTT